MKRGMTIYRQMRMVWYPKFCNWIGNFQCFNQCSMQGISQLGGFIKCLLLARSTTVWFCCVASQLVILHISIPHIMNWWTWMNIKVTVFCWNIQEAGLERLCCCSPGSQFADPDFFKSQVSFMSWTALSFVLKVSLPSQEVCHTYGRIFQGWMG